MLQSNQILKNHNNNFLRIMSMFIPLAVTVTVMIILLNNFILKAAPKPALLSLSNLSSNNFLKMHLLILVYQRILRFQRNSPCHMSNQLIEFHLINMLINYKINLVRSLPRNNHPKLNRFKKYFLKVLCKSINYSVDPITILMNRNN